MSHPHCGGRSKRVRDMGTGLPKGEAVPGMARKTRPQLVTHGPASTRTPVLTHACWLRRHIEIWERRKCLRNRKEGTIPSTGLAPRMQPRYKFIAAFLGKGHKRGFLAPVIRARRVAASRFGSI